MVEGKPENDSDAKEELVQKIYDCDESPLAYIIEPRASIRFVGKNEPELKKEDFNDLI